MSSKKQAHGAVQELRMSDVYNLSLGYSLRPVLLLDIRTTEQFNKCHCFGAVSVPINARTVNAALEAGMSTPEETAKELLSLVNVQLQRPPEHLAGMFDGVFNRKWVHYQRFVDREQSIVCVYGSIDGPLPPSSSTPTASSNPPPMSLSRRVASAIAGDV